MEAKFEVKMTRKIMYNFLMNHTYRSFTGVIGILFGLSAIAMGVMSMGQAEVWQTCLYLFFGIWFLLYLPVSLYSRAGRQVKTNPTFKSPIGYTINDRGISTNQGDRHAHIAWTDMQKVTETKLSLLAYTGKRYSFVLPKESMGSQYDTVVKLMKKNMDPKKVKVKG